MNKNLYIYLFTALMGLSVASCKDDDLMEEMEKTPESELVVGSDQHAISFLVTLDRLGGTTGTRANPYNPMEDIESFIDPEKFRVLFFDSKEQFLFESKSRWVKKESEDAQSTTWYVSVPIYKYGNDDDDDWEFDRIREVLTKETFQISLLINRPYFEYADEYKNADGGSDGGMKSGWFNNNGPHWGKSDSRFPNATTINPSPKKIFDLHHSQEDPVYENKSAVKGHTGEGYYNFIMDGPDSFNSEQNVTAKTMMSSFTSWVDWEGHDSDLPNAQKPNYHVINPNSVFKKMVHPTKDHPIPMYGTQKFESIDPSAWKSGTTFSLTRLKDNGEAKDLPISLLRSCVKLELVLPKEPEFVTIWYSNIYSRCEPMNIWQPTNEIWCDGSNNSVCSEMDAIMENGPIYTTSDPGKGSALKNYQYKISWLYGIWKDKGWTFGSLGASSIKAPGKGYPNVFNPMIQRNATISYGDNPYFKNGNQYHCIIYTGERNINDPSDLSKSNNPTSTNGGIGARTLLVLVYKMKGDTKVYSTPITNYSYSTSHPARSIGTATYDANAAIARGDVDTYANTVSTDGTNKNYRPWPLIRNHVYRLYFKGTTRAGDDYEIEAEECSSPTICFPQAVLRANKQGMKPATPATFKEKENI